jgi:hypothetical protein
MILIDLEKTYDKMSKYTNVVTNVREWDNESDAFSIKRRFHQR